MHSSEPVLLIAATPAGNAMFPLPTTARLPPATALAVGGVALPSRATRWGRAFRGGPSRCTATCRNLVTDDGVALPLAVADAAVGVTGDGAPGPPLGTAMVDARREGREDIPTDDDDDDDVAATASKEPAGAGVADEG